MTRAFVVTISLLLSVNAFADDAFSCDALRIPERRIALADCLERWMGGAHLPEVKEALVRMRAGHFREAAEQFGRASTHTTDADEAVRHAAFGAIVARRRLSRCIAAGKVG